MSNFLIAFINMLADAGGCIGYERYRKFVTRDRSVLDDAIMRMNDIGLIDIWNNEISLTPKTHSYINSGDIEDVINSLDIAGIFQTSNPYGLSSDDYGNGEYAYMAAYSHNVPVPRESCSFDRLYYSGAIDKDGNTFPCDAILKSYMHAVMKVTETIVMSTRPIKFGAWMFLYPFSSKVAPIHVNYMNELQKDHMRLYLGDNHIQKVFRDHDIDSLFQLNDLLNKDRPEHSYVYDTLLYRKILIT